MEVWELVSGIRPEELADKVRSIVAARLPVPIEEIIRTFDIDVEIYDLPDSISGVYCEVCGHPVIGVNSNHHTTRQRFTVAHELYHFLAESCEEQIATMLTTCEGVEQNERNANRFAAALLMPQRPVHGLYEKGMCLRHMAETFEVSEQAMLVRLRDLGIKRKTMRKSNMIIGDCCEFARYSRHARAPYLVEHLSSWFEHDAVCETSQLALPLAIDLGSPTRTREGEEDGYKEQRTESVADIGLHRQEG